MGASFFTSTSSLLYYVQVVKAFHQREELKHRVNIKYILPQIQCVPAIFYFQYFACILQTGKVEEETRKFGRHPTYSYYFNAVFYLFISQP